MFHDMASPYRFLDFELDEARFELRRGSKLIAVQARVFRLLAYLVRHRERVITRSELIDKVWDGTVVSDTAISQVIMLARKALNDDQQTSIITVRGQGFRFAAETEQSQRQPSVEPSANIERIAAVARTRVPLCGRERQLNELMQRAEQTERGRGLLLLLEGEPGIGKSWLLDRLATEVLERDGKVWRGAAFFDDSAPALWPWSQVVRSLIDAVGIDTVRRNLEGETGWLSAWVPELDVTRTRKSTRPADSIAQDRFRAFAALVKLLSAACESGVEVGPRVLLLEDLQRFDEASLQLLRYAAQELRNTRLLIVGSYSSLEHTQNKALIALLSGLPSTAQRMTLPSLSANEMRELIESELGDAPARQMATMQRLCHGNPLLLHELMHTARESGDCKLSVSLPIRIHEAVAKHLAQLPEATRQTLAVASVAGRELSLALLARLVAQDETTVLRLLDPALQAGVLRAASEQLGKLLFAREVVRSFLYFELPHSQRVALHRTTGELLEESAAPLDELAHHFVLAASAETRDKARDYARRAAEQTLAEGNAMRAAELFDCAAGHCDTRSPTLLDLLQASAEAWYAYGDHEASRKRLEQVAQRASSLRDSERCTRAMMRMAWVERGAIVFGTTRLMMQLPLLDALPQTAEIDTLRWGITAMCAPLGPEERTALAYRSIERARSCENSALLCTALDCALAALAGIAELDELNALANELYALAANGKEQELQLDALLFHMYVAGRRGDLSGALRALERQQELLESCTVPLQRYAELCVDASASFMTANFVRARQQSALAAKVGARLDPGAALYDDLRNLLAFILYDVADGDVRRCDLDAIPPDFRPFWALAWLRDGRLPEAQLVFRYWCSGEFPPLSTEGLRLPIYAALSELTVQLGESGPLAMLYDRLSPFAGQHIVMMAGVHLGPVSYYLAILAQARGAHATARGHFEAALREATSFVALAFLPRIELAYQRLKESTPAPRKLREQRPA